MLDPSILRPESQQKVGGWPCQVGGPEGTMPDRNIFQPASRCKVEGRPGGAGAGNVQALNVWGSRSLFPDTQPLWGNAIPCSHAGRPARAGRQGQRGVYSA